MTDEPIDPRRELLRQVLQRDEHELRAAVQELTEAARERFAMTKRIREAPMLWLLGGFAFGVWLGSRRRRAVYR